MTRAADSAIVRLMMKLILCRGMLGSVAIVGLWPTLRVSDLSHASEKKLRRKPEVA
jgi:hypothetical protein